MYNFTIAIALLVLTGCQAQDSTEKSATGTGGGRAAPAAKESAAKPAADPIVARCLALVAEEKLVEAVAPCTRASAAAPGNADVARALVRAKAGAAAAAQQAAQGAAGPAGQAAQGAATRAQGAAQGAAQQGAGQVPGQPAVPKAPSAPAMP